MILRTMFTLLTMSTTTAWALEDGVVMPDLIEEGIISRGDNVIASAELRFALDSILFLGNIKDIEVSFIENRFNIKKGEIRLRFKGFPFPIYMMRSKWADGSDTFIECLSNVGIDTRGFVEAIEPLKAAGALSMAEGTMIGRKSAPAAAVSFGTSIPVGKYDILFCGSKGETYLVRHALEKKRVWYYQKAHEIAILFPKTYTALSVIVAIALGFAMAIFPVEKLPFRRIFGWLFGAA